MLALQLVGECLSELVGQLKPGMVALRIMEERKALLKKMEKDHAKRGSSVLANTYRQKGEDIQSHVDKMKEVLFASQKSI